MAGLLSPLTGNIYFPALNSIQEELHTTTELVNLTITLYMVLQGVSPAFWGAFADAWGRRPIYLTTLAVYLGTCIGCALAPNYPALLVLRMLQAFGSSSVIAIGAGVISDIALPSERGRLSSLVASGQILGPCIGPIIGGVLSEAVSWRWTFWFLVIYGGVVYICLLFLLPETLRILVGNGSGYANPTPLQWIKRRRLGITTDNSTASTIQRKQPNPLRPFIYLLQPDIAVMLIFYGIIYANMYALMVTIPNQFGIVYGLNELQMGLCYLPLGVGCVIGAYTNGYLMDRSFKVEARNYGCEPKVGRLPIDFPVFRCRLRTTWINIIFIDIIAIVYGWLLQQRVHLAAPLILQFVYGISIMGANNTFQTLMIDLYPGKGASITASNNFVRCLLGAVATVVIDPGISGVGVGWMFTILGLIMTASNLLLVILRIYGPRWRKARMEKQDRSSKHTTH
ncbi:MFS general substrate transporter [Lichtheimia hyalospora FSU 10163]|nr:MFS general substrate transporter [Lichtheimia hyalospora FSU 10163]